MSDSHDAHDVHKAVKRYMLVFVALLVGTVITVAVSRPSVAHSLGINSMTLTITIALFIASVKAFLVAGYFMHLISERKMIYGILAATVFFFAGLMYLTVWSMHHENLVHYKQSVP